MTLAEFLEARLAEEEATATAVEDHSEPWPGKWEADDPRVKSYSGWSVAMVSAPGAAAHIARHDPARVLREVAAKRAILRYFTNPEGEPVAIGIADTPEQLGRGDVTALPGSWVLRELAAVYDSHPDYDPAWRL